MIEKISITFEADSPYRRLAKSLDALPNRFPPAADGSDLRLLARLFSPDEAALAAELQPDAETPASIARRLEADAREITSRLKEMAKKGLVGFGKTAEGKPGFWLMPFVVGIYEAQGEWIDAELARLFEDYFMQGFGRLLDQEPQLHRVVPVGESIANPMEVRPFESASGLIEQMQSWGVIDCICRKQKALVGEACGHPVDVCMVLSNTPDAFAGGSYVRSLTREEAHQTLRRAAEAGLVHCVSNNQREVWYICNCCTCSCGILRGMVDLGIANVVARSAFVNVVDADLCIACGECLETCQFGALSLEASAQVSGLRCVGCGVCVPVCPQGALSLVRRDDDALPPLDESEWRAARLPGTG